MICSTSTLEIRTTNGYITLSYRGKQLFRTLVDNPSLLAQTVLGIILICLINLVRLIPISKLTPDFLFKQIYLTAQAVTSVPADVKAIIYYRKGVNQLIFLKIIPQTPCRTMIS